MTASSGPAVITDYEIYTRYAHALTQMRPEEAVRLPSVFLQKHARLFNGKTGSESPLILEPWQIFAVDDPSGQAIYLKPRQVGFSFLRAARALGLALLRRNYIGAFVSYNRDEAKNKIVYARQLYESMQYKGKPGIKNDNAESLTFLNGSRIISLPAKAVRGLPNPDVFFDEWAFIPKAAEIFTGTLSSGVRGLGKFAGGSTPYGESNHFYEVFINENNQYRKFKRHRIEWWYSPAMCDDVPQAIIHAPSLSTEERVEQYGSEKLKEIFAALSLDDFQREHECSFAARDDAVISKATLLECCVWPEEDTPDGQEVKPDLNRVDAVVRNWVNPTMATLEREIMPALRVALKAMHPSSSFIMGYDVGRSGDGSQLVIFEERRDEALITRAFIRLHGAEFHVQESMLMSLCGDRRHRKTHIDSTGIGMQLAENVRRRSVGRNVPEDEGAVIRVNFGNERDRTKVFASVKQAVENVGILVYPHEDLFRHFAAFKYEPESGRFGDRFTLNRGKNKDGTRHHAEVVVAMGLALFEYGRLRPRTLVPNVRDEVQLPQRGRSRRTSLWIPANRTPAGYHLSRGGLFVPDTH
ncbi:terminase large subunit domain-containing protein [Deinococcus kurensis]|uniref:terminase large subunit domain-containing protein n=1 Tax=Deinococcus kurensis TaxID=2662757 RepID=UPI0012D3553F|nr:terminase family protein [Deinococcus kurensis]